MWFFIILFVLILAFFIYSRTRISPWTNVLIFGKQGSGKTTLLVKWMIRDLKRGYTVYTDIPDIQIKGVRQFDTLDLSNSVPPPKSAIYLDEVGLSFDSRKFKTFPDGLRDFFALHRHYKCKIVSASQSFDVDKKIRDRTHKLYLQTTICGVIGITRPILRSITLTEASSQGESRIADQLKFGSIFSWKFTWMPRYSRYFDSFAAPEKPDLPYKECKVSARKQLRYLQKAFDKQDKPQA